MSLSKALFSGFRSSTFGAASVTPALRLSIRPTFGFKSNNIFNNARTFFTSPRTSRQYINQGSTFTQRTAQDNFWKAAATAGLLGIAGICFLGTMSTDHRHDSLGDVAASRVATAYGYVAGGLGVTALTVVSLRRSPMTLRYMGSWAFMGVTFLGGLGSLIATQMVDYHTSPLLKHACFGIFTATMGLSLVPLGVIGGAVITRAAYTTGAIVGALSAIAACAPNESFLWMGGIAGIGLGAVVAAGFAGMIFPSSALLYNISIYGGLGVFGLMMLVDSQRLYKEAREGNMRYGGAFDPINASLGIYLNTINIFVRIATILMNSGSNKRK